MYITNPIRRDLVRGLSLAAAIWLPAVALLLYATSPAWGYPCQLYEIPSGGTTYKLCYDYANPAQPKSVSVASCVYSTGVCAACTEYTRNGNPWSCVGPTGQAADLGACVWRVGVCYGIGLKIVPL